MEVTVCLIALIELQVSTLLGHLHGCGDRTS